VLSESNDAVKRTATPPILAKKGRGATIAAPLSVKNVRSCHPGGDPMKIAEGSQPPIVARCSRSPVADHRLLITADCCLQLHRHGLHFGVVC
jgi:hypothetical protein